MGVEKMDAKKLVYLGKLEGLIDGGT